MTKYIIIVQLFPFYTYPGRMTMGLIDLKELFSRIRFLGSNLKYNSRKHFYLTTLCLVVILVLIFTAVFIRQRTEIIRKENIVKSFYAGEGSGSGTVLVEETGAADDLQEKVFFTVHICGEVQEPGVYDIESGLRIVDLIDLAGGATDSACLEAVNLAMEAGDGQRIYIPSFEEVEEEGPLYYGDTTQLYINDTGNSGAGSMYGNIVNINTAGQEELEILPGIGPATAKKIIEHRNKYGHFKTKEELMDVSGIGPKKYGDLKDLIKI